MLRPEPGSAASQFWAEVHRTRSWQRRARVRRGWKVETRKNPIDVVRSNRAASPGDFRSIGAAGGLASGAHQTHPARIAGVEVHRATAVGTAARTVGAQPVLEDLQVDLSVRHGDEPLGLRILGAYIQGMGRPSRLRNGRTSVFGEHQGSARIL